MNATKCPSPKAHAEIRKPEHLLHLDGSKTLICGFCQGDV